MNLKPLDITTVDPRLSAVLEPGETVLWQGAPKPGSLPGPRPIIGAAVLLAVGVALALALVGSGIPPQTRYAFAAACAGLAVIVLVQAWLARGSLWTYAITDRRLVSVMGGRLIRSVSAAQLDRAKLGIRGQTVFWFRHLNSRGNSDPENLPGPDGRLIGFHGQTDPQAVLGLIEEWRLGLSRRAAAEADAFVVAMSGTSDADKAAVDGTVAASPVREGAVRVRLPGTGLSIDVPAAWKMTTRTSYDGPLRIFGVTLLPRIIRPGTEAPYQTGASWTHLRVTAAPEAGITIAILDRPLETTLDQVVGSAWNQITGSRIIRQDPDIRVPPFTGFGVVRSLPAGAGLAGIEALSGATMLRQMWLGDRAVSIEVTGYALEGQASVQTAIDAALSSLAHAG